MRQHIPNFFTLSNLFFGCCAVVFLLNQQIPEAAWCILGAFLCDYSDGMVARALRVASPLGRELDSLADVVSFGVAPGAMLYYLLKAGAWSSVTFYLPLEALPNPGTFAGSALYPICPAALPGFILSMFSAYRLAKFNLDTRQKNYFIGLSTPGCTLFVLGLTLACYHNQFGIGDFVLGMPWILYGLIGVLSYLLISEIPMFGLKFRSFRWKENRLPYFFLVLGISALITLKGVGLSLLILFYLVLSLFLKHKITGTENSAGA